MFELVLNENVYVLEDDMLHVCILSPAWIYKYYMPTIIVFKQVFFILKVYLRFSETVNHRLQ